MYLMEVDNVNIAGRNEIGFSLVQLLATILIFAILILLGMPTLTDLIIQYRVKSATESLYSHLSYAQLEAIRQEIAVTVIFQTGSTWCYGITTATTCDCNTAGSCNLGQTNYSEFNQTSLSLSGFDNNKTTFDSVRGVPNVIGDITFTGSNADAITVHINKMGLPSTCSTNVGGYPTTC